MKSQRSVRPFRLSSTLSVELHMIKENRNYIFSHNNAKVDYDHLFFKFANMPRPNHGMKLQQVEEIAISLLRIVRAVKEGQTPDLLIGQTL